MQPDSRSVYLDHAATTPVRPEVMDAMLPYFTEAYGNPSSVHGLGSAAHSALERARQVVGEVLGCRPGEIIFTGSGTEADNLALHGVARARRPHGTHIVTTQIEHDAVRRSCSALENEGFRVTYLPVDGYGLIDPDVLASALQDDTILVSIIYANNEIGTIQPIREIGRIVRSRGIVFHTDAVQAVGSLAIDVDELGVDLLTISGHKIYGPKGVGALYARRGTPLSALLHGGDQERGRRSGTENLPGIMGLAVALILAEHERPTESIRLTLLRDRLIGGILARVPHTHLTGHPGLRLPGHASFYLERMTGELVLVDLDMAGIACSSGSACHAGSTDPSHVLTAIGLPATMARNGVRMTLGRENTVEDIDYVLDVMEQTTIAQHVS